ncbi:leucine-rich repeat protein [Saccharicrinis aurantiacus]|uniref:leucine-rich repeat protein n=1 Tax=Saccharicrinis aurantiacus TaxID=1849719 RepID=UPI00248FF276|nr:leucine-rich repeat protein [Saccharicrinis aurantiacus]
MKKFYLAMLLAFCYVAINAQSYTLTDSDVTVVDGTITECTYNFALKDIIIPDVLDGQTILGIGRSVFEGKELVGVTLPSTLLEIGVLAFYGNNIVTLNIPASVITILSSAFKDNNNLSSLIFEEGSSIEYIYSEAFRNNKISSLHFPASIKIIHYAAFTNTTANNELESITFEDNSSLIYIHSSFRGNNKYTLPTSKYESFEYYSIYDGLKYYHGDEIGFNESVSTIAPYTLKDNDVNIIDGTIDYCANSIDFRNIIIPDILQEQNVTGIADNVFRARDLKIVSLPASLKHIGNEAFWNNNGMNVIIPENSQLETIGSRAFVNSSISNLTIPSTVTKIGFDAFKSCSISSLNFEPNSNIMLIEGYAFRENPITELTIPASVKEIGSYAFKSCSISSLNFEPNSNIMLIESNAFIDNEITKFVLPTHTYSNFKHYYSKDSQFNPGDEITDLSLEIKALMPYILTNNDVVVEDGIITSCSYSFELKNIIIPSTINNQNIKKIADNVFYSKRITDLELPEGLEEIGQESFAHNDITNLQLPASLIKISKEAFLSNFCNSISFAEGTKLEYIGEGAFRFNRNQIKNLTIPASVKHIDYKAFLSSKIEELSFESNSNIRYIGIDAFSANSESMQISLPSHAYPNFQYYYNDSKEFQPSDIITDYTKEIRAFTPYTLTDADVTITDGVITQCRYSFQEKHIIIPLTLNNQTITGIGDEVFKNKEILSISIPKEVKHIGAYAFSNNNISNLDLPNGIINIGNHAFSYCDIKLLKIPESLESIGEYTFYNNSIESLIIPSNVKDIGKYSFKNNNISSLTFEQNSNIQIIGEHAFNNNVISQYILPVNKNPDFVYYITNNAKLNQGDINSNLQHEVSSYLIHTLTDNEVTIIDGSLIECNYSFDTKNIAIPSMLKGQTVVEIGDEAFKEKDIISVELPPSLVEIGSSAFSKNNMLSVSLPQSIKTIGSQAFYNNDIASLELPNGIENIDSEAFASNSIISLTLPSSLKDIGNKAFYHNWKMTLVIPENSKLENIGDEAFSRCGIKALVIPSSVKKIGFRAFEMNYISNLTFEANSNILSIGNYAFLNNNIEKYILPTHADDNFFIYQVGSYQYNPGDELDAESSLTSIIPYTLTDDDAVVVDGVITECTYSFDNKSIVIPNTLGDQTITSIGNGTFASKSINYISLPESLITIEESAFQSNRIAKLSIPANVQRIEKNAFRSNNITEIELSDNSKLETIGNWAFFSCNISEFNFPINLKTIKEGAFNGNRISTLTIPSNVSTIGAYAFKNNTITSLTFTENSQIRTIGQEAFLENPDLSSYLLPTHQEDGFQYYIDSDNNKINPGESISDFSKKVNTVVHYTLTDSDVEVVNDKLISCNYSFEYKNIIIPAILDGQEVKEIGDSVFQNKYLTYIKFPETLEVIGRSAFERSRFKDVSFPSTIKKINPYAFCSSGIERVVFESESNLLYLSRWAFLSNDKLTEIELPTHSGNFRYYYTFNSSTEYLPGQLISDFSNDIMALVDYQLTDDEVEVVDGIITSCSIGTYDKSIIIPSTLDDQEITGINCLDLCNKGIRYLQLPNSMEYIGEKAFFNNSLTEIILPNSIIELDNSSFEKNKIETVSIPSSLKLINQNAFRYNNLTKVDFIENSEIEKIELNAFADNDNLKEIILPNHNSKSFDYYYSTKNYLPMLPDDKFVDFSSYFYALISYTLTDEDVTVEDGVITSYSNNTDHKSITIPDELDGEKIIGIGYNVFRSKWFRKVHLPSQLVTIGNSAFEHNSLHEITIPSNVEKIGYSAFSNNKVALNVNFEPNSNILYIAYNSFLTQDFDVELTLPTHSNTSFNNYSYEGSFLFAGNVITNPAAPIYAKIPYTLTDEDVEVVDGEIASCSYNFDSRFIIIPNELDGQVIKSIGAYTFNNKGIVEITLPYTITTIKEWAFRYNQLTKVSLPYNLRRIGNMAFAYNNIENVNIPQNIEYIASNIFESNTNIDINFFSPSNLLFVDEDAFAGHEVSLPRSLYSDFNGYSTNDGTTVQPDAIIDASKSYQTDATYTFVDGDLVVEDGVITAIATDYYHPKITIPSNLNNQRIIGIGDEVFSHKQIVAVNLPHTLTQIGDRTFEYCKINSIVLPDNLETIGNRAFADNYLTEIIIPNAVKQIGESAFNSRSIIESISFEENSTIKSIGKNAFKGFEAFPLQLPTDNANAGFLGYRLQGGNTTDAITSHGYAYLTRIPYTIKDNDVEVEDGVITSVSDEFTEGDIIIPNVVDNESIIAIATEVFNAKGILSIELPNTIESIGEKAFYGNYIRTLHFPTSIVNIGYQAFYYSNNITQVTFDNNSNLESIGQYAFSGSNTVINLPTSSNPLFIHYAASGNVVETEVPIELFLSSSVSIATYSELQADDMVVEDGVIIEYTGTKQNIIIPSVVDGQTISGVGSSVFEKKNLNYLILPETIEDIGPNAFKYNLLKEIHIPKSIIRIGYGAFRNNKLESILFENESKLLKLGKYAFDDNTIEHISLPTNINSGFGSIYRAIFDQEIPPLTEYSYLMNAIYTDIPYEVKDDDVIIGNGTITSYQHNDDYFHVIIPDELNGQKVEGISDAFQTKNIGEIKLPSHLKRLETLALMNNYLTKIVIPASVDTIEYWALDAMYPLKEITFEENSNIRYIDKNAFIVSNPKDLMPIFFPTHSSNKFTSYRSGNGTDLSEGDEVLTIGTSYTTIFADSKISFDGNEHSYGSVPTPINAPNGETIILPSAASFRKKDHKFVNWNTSADGTGNSYEAGEEFEVGLADITLYATWEFYNGVKDLNNEVKKVYPNPTNGIITIVVDNKLVSSTLSLYNTIGTKVKQIQITGIESNENISDLPDGVYLLMKDNHIIDKIIKK